MPERPVCVLCSVCEWPSPHMRLSLEHKAIERRKEIKSLSRVNVGRKQSPTLLKGRSRVLDPDAWRREARQGIQTW